MQRALELAVAVLVPFRCTPCAGPEFEERWTRTISGVDGASQKKKRPAWLPRKHGTKLRTLVRARVARYPPVCRSLRVERGNARYDLLLNGAPGQSQQ